MTNDEKLMQQALEALEVFATAYSDGNEAIAALRERLAQPEQAAEPVAITEAMAFAFHRAITDGALGSDDLMDIMRGLEAAFAHITGPKASPPAIKPLTEYQKWRMYEAGPDMPSSMAGVYMRAVDDTEAAHGIKGDA